MSVEVFVHLGDGAPRRTVAELQADLARLGALFTVEGLAGSPWLVLAGPTADGHPTDMSVTVDPDGVATSAMVQVGSEPPEVLDRLLAAFVRLGWERRQCLAAARRLAGRAGALARMVDQQHAQAARRQLLQRHQAWPLDFG